MLPYQQAEWPWGQQQEQEGGAWSSHQQQQRQQQQLWYSQVHHPYFLQEAGAQADPLWDVRAQPPPCLQPPPQLLQHEPTPAPPPPQLRQPLVHAPVAVPAGVLVSRNQSYSPQRQSGKDSSRAGGGWGGRKAAVPPNRGGASGSAAATACRQLNNRLRGAASAEDLFAAMDEGWRALDVINLSTAFHRLTQLAEVTPAGGVAFRASLRGNSTWFWLLDQLISAAEAPEFGEQCTTNVLCALCKLDALSPTLLHALHAPLARLLGGGGGGTGGAPLTMLGLTQVLWAFGAEDSLGPLLLQLKAQLFDVLWAAAPCLDGQAVATAWWALGEISSRCAQQQELHLAAEVPSLLPRLAQTAAAAAGTLTFQGLSQVLHACTKMRPQPYHDVALLHALATAAARRQRSGVEQPSPQAVGLIALAFGRLGFCPRCYWCTERGINAHVLDDLGSAVVERLESAKPQELCSYLTGLGLLSHNPPGNVLHAVLLHLSAGAACSGSGSSEEEGAISSSSSRVGGRGRLALERFSSQQLVDLLVSLRGFLRGGHYQEAVLPPQTLFDFFDALDTVLGVRLAISSEPQDPREHDELLLTAQHVGAICGELGRLAEIPGTALTEATVQELERHIIQAPSASYSGPGLANVLHFYAAHGLQPSQQVAEAVCERLLSFLSPQQQQLTGSVLEQQPLPLHTLGKLLYALAGLHLHHHGLLSALLPAVATALAAQEQAVLQGGSVPPTLLRELTIIAGALGGLHATSLLHPAGLATVGALLPFWHSLMAWVGYAAEWVAHSGGGDMALADARILQQTATQLSSGLAGGKGRFFLPPVVQRVLATQR